MKLNYWTFNLTYNNLGFVLLGYYSGHAQYNLKKEFCILNIIFG